jgi:tetratricopeptide (TPR) repeat protein
MTAELEQLANAFGAGQYVECRRLAESLLAGDHAPAAKQQAAGFLIESHLAEGDFDGARAAANRVGDQDSIARIGKLESHYGAKVSRLQRIIATTRDPAKAAQAQLLLARAHQVAGREQLAASCYSKVIQAHPRRTEASQAVAHIAALAIQEGNYAKGTSQMREVVRRYPGTPAAAAAQLATGGIYRAAGDTGKAGAAYLITVRNHRSDPLGARAREELAFLHYAEGAKAEAGSDVAAALAAYRKGVHADPSRERKAKYSLHIAGLCTRLERWEEARAAANEVLKLNPPTPQFAAQRRAVRILIAGLCCNQGFYPEALARYEELLAESTDLKEQQTLAATIADIKSQMNPDPLYVETPGGQLGGAQEEAQ